MQDFSTAPTRAILDFLSSPDKGLKIIHISGTDGKGSTALMMTDILIAAGKKVGTFTSPEVYSYYDQFSIDGKNIDPALFEKYKERASDAEASASEFEVNTAAAIYAFYKEGCEYAVIECGMGGLNDATNAIKSKVLAIICTISFDHTQYLGNTIEQICAHKAGIIKNCPVVVNAHQSDGVIKYFKKHHKNCRFATKIDSIFDGGFIYDGKKYSLNSSGCLQPYNAACAIEGAKILGIDERAIYEGIACFSPRGALDIFYLNGRRYILDGAHNPAAFVQLSDYLKKNACDTTIIFGCLNDKDIDGNLSNISADRIIAVECPSPRTRAIDDIEEHCKKYFNEVTRANGVSEALERADAEQIVICGSFTLLKEAFQWISKRL